MVEQWQRWCSVAVVVLWSVMEGGWLFVVDSMVNVGMLELGFDGVMIF